MFIQAPPPNPATLKFIPGLTVLDSCTLKFTDAAQAARSPLAARLFDSDDVSCVFYATDFVTIAKDKGE